MRLVASRSSDRTSECLRISLVSRLAYESAPTAVTVARPVPVTTCEPESSGAPSSLNIGSDSPVSIDSSSDSPVLSHHDRIGGHLVAGTQHEQVVEHHVFERHRHDLAAAPHAAVRGRQQRRPVEHALRAILLHDADQRVDDDDAEEEAVPQVAEEEDGDEAGGEDAVEQREDVLAQDVAHRARAGLRLGVDPAVRDALGYLGGASAPRVSPPPASRPPPSRASSLCFYLWDAVRRSFVTGFCGNWPFTTNHVTSSSGAYSGTPISSLVSASALVAASVCAR